MCMFNKFIYLFYGDWVMIFSIVLFFNLIHLEQKILTIWETL